MITDELVTYVGEHPSMSIQQIAKKFKVKPVDVRIAYDAWLKRKPKTSESERAQTEASGNSVRRNSRRNGAIKTKIS